MERALALVNDAKKSVYYTSKQTGVPYETLRRRITDALLHNRDLSEYVISYGSFDESFNYYKQSLRNNRNII